MRAPVVSLFPMILLLALTGAAPDTAPVAEESGEATPVPALPTALEATDVPRTGRPSALMNDIEAVFLEAKEKVDALEAQAANASDESAFLRLQREIEELHRSTELRILQLQADHLRHAGREDAARRIEAAIAAADAPRAAPAPVDRALPPTDSR